MATVELSDRGFWVLYNHLDHVRREFWKAHHASGRNQLFSNLSVDGTEYDGSKVFEACRELERYCEETGANSFDFDAAKALESDPLYFPTYDLETDRKKQTPSMEFKLWDYILPLIGKFKRPDFDADSDEPNDWSPPANFQSGTDDEREVWEDHQRPKE